MPQFARSVSVSRHEPVQSVRPASHEVTHMLPEHTWPEAHARPHIPQWARSLVRSRHEPEQLVRPGVHDTTHMPPEQT